MPKQYPRELRERAVRLLAEHRGDYETEYAAIRSIAAKLGIATRRGARSAATGTTRRIPRSSGTSLRTSSYVPRRCEHLPRSPAS